MAASEIAGTLPYLAPEQTGRTGRPVDQRSDLYALGATLYELATGRPPFGDGDPFQLIYDHLARVPAPPAELARHVPPAMSDVIMRLLEKEPDRRYQSAEGLAHDLSHPRHGASEPSTPGTRRTRLPAAPVGPSRLSVDKPRWALQMPHRARATTVVVCSWPGHRGVGKTALVDELRPIVTAGGGWMVKGKLDQYRQDSTSGGVWQAIRALARLLLAESEEDLAAQRAHMLAALGHNAGLIAAMLPEVSLLLDVAPETTVEDPTMADRRLQQACVDLVGAIVSTGRPLVMALDDLQWAGSTPMGVVEALLCVEVRGLLVVGAYRETDVGPTHPLSATMSRWERHGNAPRRVRLDNLPATHLVMFIQEMLRLRQCEATQLAGVIGERTAGNPYDTVELVNALRRDGALLQNACGWSWNATTLRRYVGRGDVVDLLTNRIDALPAESRTLLEVMACLGGDVALWVLEAATGRSAATVEAQLTAPLEDGLLTLARDTELVVRFRHDRVQQAAYDRLEADHRRALQLSVARHLAGFPDLVATAAEQYLPVVDTVDDPGERRHVATLFRRAASAVRLTNPTVAERFLAAAVVLLERLANPSNDGLLFTVETERHAVPNAPGPRTIWPARSPRSMRRCARPRRDNGRGTRL